MHEIPVTEARAEFSELISRVAYGGEPVVITRHGKPLVALVPAAYLDAGPAKDAEGADQPSAQITVLDISATGESSGPFTVAAHHQGDRTTR